MSASLSVTVELFTLHHVSSLSSAMVLRKRVDSQSQSDSRVRLWVRVRVRLRVRMRVRVQAKVVDWDSSPSGIGWV